MLFTRGHYFLNSQSLLFKAVLHGFVRVAPSRAEPMPKDAGTGQSQKNRPLLPGHRPPRFASASPSADRERHAPLTPLRCEFRIYLGSPGLKLAVEAPRIRGSSDDRGPLAAQRSLASRFTTLRTTHCNCFCVSQADSNPLPRGVTASLRNLPSINPLNMDQHAQRCIVSRPVPSPKIWAPIPQRNTYGSRLRVRCPSALLETVSSGAISKTACHSGVDRLSVYFHLRSYDSHKSPQLTKLLRTDPQDSSQSPF